MSHKIKIEVTLAPFPVTKYVLIKDAPEGVKNSIPLTEVAAEILDKMCEEFRREVFMHAGKKDPEEDDKILSVTRIVNFNIDEIDAETLEGMCQDYINEVFKQAGKIRPRKKDSDEKAPTDSGIEELDDLCINYNNGDLDLKTLVNTIWNTALFMNNRKD